jgi:4-diphosphocytidyl-2-C-methyl-D-erythritol kinase
LNLSLRILGRREDGFHEIDSVMVSLPGLADGLTIERAAEDVFESDAEDLPTDASNLVIRAREAFRQATGRVERVRIRLEKRIPHGAGLGGGSSDAAATLRGLNDLLGAGLDGTALQRIGAGIGSDVPFFLGPEVARVTGRGERIEAGPPWRAVPVVLLKPGFGVPTPEAYAGWRDAAAVAGAAEEAGPEAGEPSLGGVELRNDLERPVFAKYLFLAEVKDWLRAQPEVAAALMSGSGSTMFAILRRSEDGDPLIERARRELDPTLWAWSGMTAGAAEPAATGRG